MPLLTNGQYLNQYVAPQLLDDFRNYNDDFIGVLKPAPKAALTADGIRFNKLNNDIKFYVNNTTDFTPRKITGKKGFVEWEKYDTEPTEIDDAEIRYLAYNKRAEERVMHTDAFKLGYRDHVIHKLAPDGVSDVNMPVLLTSGANDGTGRKRLIFKDLADFLEKVSGLNLKNLNELYMVLNPKHVTDLILDRDAANYFAANNVWFDAKTGELHSFMGFKFFKNNQAPIYDQNGDKKALYALPAAKDQALSTLIYAPLTVKHLDSVKILYKSETEDTRSADPKSEFRTQTYGLVDRILDYGFGGILSANV